jgi:hypothetical protein
LIIKFIEAMGAAADGRKRIPSHYLALTEMHRWLTEKKLKLEYGPKWGGFVV